MNQQTLAWNASKQPSHEDKTPRTSQMATIAPYLTNTNEDTKTSQQEILTCLFQGAYMKPIDVKLWKRHNLVISCATNVTIKTEMHAATPRRCSPNPTSLNPSYFYFEMVGACFPHPPNTQVIALCAYSRIPYIAQGEGVVGYHMKPTAVKLWKRHNLVISCTAHSTTKMKCMQSHLTCIP